MNKAEIRKRLSKITVWKRVGQRAPHKPLLALYVLGRYSRGEGRLVSYAEVDRDLRELLVEFGPQRKSHHPEYPFWRLQNDGVWEVSNADILGLRKSSSDAKKSELLKHDVHGGFKKEIYNKLAKDKAFVAKIAQDLLEANFPPTIHEDILQAVGLDVDIGTAATTMRRSPLFR